jgi:hypothetical protein
MPAIAPPDRDEVPVPDELLVAVPKDPELLVLLPFELDPFEDDDVSIGSAA